jgi:uncharacterized RDD family membrane protein YckC
MRCPKCHYISFDSTDRCRNCGYEFSFSAPAAPLDLPIQTGDEPLGPLADFSLTDLDEPPAAEPPAAAPPAARERPAPAARRQPAREPVREPEPREPVAQPRPITSSFDLPLFKDRRPDDDRPLVTPPAVPRAPLAVRRSNPTPTRIARSQADEPELDLGAFDEPQPRTLPRPTFTPDPETIGAPDAGMSMSARPGPRVLAALVDGLVLGSVAMVVLYFTLKVCGLDFKDAAVLPPVPFGAFIALLAGGYFILFTVAGGQTIGKMTAGIKVVLVEEEGRWSDRVPLGRAVVRAVGYLVSLLPVGLGFLPALLGADRRAIHDRLADTRVVKA